MYLLFIISLISYPITAIMVVRQSVTGMQYIPNKIYYGKKNNQECFTYSFVRVSPISVTVCCKAIPDYIHNGLRVRPRMVVQSFRLLSLRLVAAIFFSCSDL